MNQQHRACGWLLLTIVAYLFLIYAILPKIWEQNASQQDIVLPPAIDIASDENSANYSAVVYPAMDESITSASHFDSATQAAVVEPAAMILNQISDSSIPDKEAIETSATASEPSAAEQPIVEQSPAISEQTPQEAAPPIIVANIPSFANTPINTAKPEQLDLRYPNTDLDSINSPAPGEEERQSSSKESKFWTEPASLLCLLDELAKEKKSSDWATETALLVRDLGPAITNNSDRAASILDRLSKASVEADRLADSSSDLSLTRKLRQASYAIQRRLEVWGEVVLLGISSLVEADQPKTDPRRLAICLVEMNNLMNSSSEGRQWRNYLLIDAIEELTSQRSETETEQQRKLAQQVLARMLQTPMSVSQRQFMAKKPVAAFCAELRSWAAGPLTSADVLRDIERYEQTRLPSDAWQLADDMSSLLQSSDPERGKLARCVESHYRNANLRVSMSEDLLNRLIPEQNMELAPVRDTVLGRPVRGESLTSTDVALRLIPDPNRVRMALEVTGEVAAMTSSTSGPATFINDSDALYAARKPLEIDQKGIKLMPAEVDVHHQTRLRDVATDFDGIPLIGWMVRGVARSQHEMVQPMANEEARGKVASKARQRIDAEAKERLAEMVDNLNRKLFGPLVSLALEPTMIEAQTTGERMTMRLRVAGEDQLGSFTPRPQAPANCLASFQINESMLNNSLQRLQLEGRTFTLPQLVQRISERFQRPNIWKISPDYEDLTVTFAKKDAVTVRCQDGQVILTLSITEISKEPRHWNDFQVRVFYRPQVNGRSAELVRDGVIHLIGKRLNNNAQIALRGIFARAFPKNESIKLTPDRLLIDPKLQDLAITQFVIDDGWIGFAVGPQQFALQTSRSPSTKK